ncbi:MAG: STAS domain-containing protein [Spirochaetota bacterium]
MITVENNVITLHCEKAILDDKLEVEYAVERLLISGVNVIYIDLSKTIYLPSTLIGYLMWKKQELQKKNKDIIIIAISQSLRKLFEETRLIGFFGIT